MSPEKAGIIRVPTQAEKALADARPRTEQREFCEALDEVLAEIREILAAKNERYGNSALDPVRIFSSADTLEQIRVRMDDKLSRIRAGVAGDNEDAKLDLLGYLILERIAEGKPRGRD